MSLERKVAYVLIVVFAVMISLHVVIYGFALYSVTEVKRNLDSSPIVKDCVPGEFPFITDPPFFVGNDTHRFALSTCEWEILPMYAPDCDADFAFLYFNTHTGMCDIRWNSVPFLQFAGIVLVIIIIMFAAYKVLKKRLV